MNIEKIKLVIDRVFDNNEDVTPDTSGEVRESIETALDCLDKGELRVAEPLGNSKWQVNQWLKNENNKLSFIFVEYTNDNGDLEIQSVQTRNIEEVEYEISNQGKGLLQPKRYRNKVVFRSTISRSEWMEEFKIKYADFIDKQIKRFEEKKKHWC